MYALGLFTYAGLHACLHAYIDGLMVYGWDECFHTCRYAYMYVCLCVRVYIYVCIPTYIYKYVCACVYVCMSVYVCMLAMYACTYVWGRMRSSTPEHFELRSKLSILSCVPNLQPESHNI